MREIKLIIVLLLLGVGIVSIIYMREIKLIIVMLLYLPVQAIMILWLDFKIKSQSNSKTNKFKKTEYILLNNLLANTHWANGFLQMNVSDAFDVFFSILKDKFQQYFSDKRKLFGINLLKPWMTVRLT